MAASEDTSSMQQQQEQQQHNNTRPVTFNDHLQHLEFSGDAIDMALRKLLSKALLPKEAQQIDRAMEDFAKRYHECNPDLTDSSDAVYAVAFSVLLLHTDAHNKNVRRKMNKETFIMRTKIIEGGENVSSEVLDIMYDNIVSTQFTYADGNDERPPSAPERSGSWLGRLARSDSSGTLNSVNMDDLYPKLSQLMPPENPYCYKRALRPLPIADAYSAFVNARPLQLGGVRSKHHTANRGETSPSVDTQFTVRVAKAAILERKYDMLPGGKKATARGWRPFGVVLSGSQVIFFSDLGAFESWVAASKNNNTPPSSPSTTSTASTTRRFPSLPMYMATGSSSNNSMDDPTESFSSQQSLQTNNSNIPIISNHSNDNNNNNAQVLRPVQIISLADAVCIHDDSYTKYPYVFRLMTGDGQLFLLRAKNNADLDDWMLKINYAAASKTNNVRLRPPRQGSHRDKRQEVIKKKVMMLSQRLIECERPLRQDLQLRRNLMVLVPLQKSSKDRILYYAELVGKQIQSKRLHMQRLECYREMLEASLAWFEGNSGGGDNSSSRPSTLASSATAPVIRVTHNNNSSNNNSNSHHATTTTDDNNMRRSSCPQIPPFPFTLDESSVMSSAASTPIASSSSSSEKKVAFDVPTVSITNTSNEDNINNIKWMRRRSSSNPVKPAPVPTSCDGLQQKILRERSGSEVSRDDDELTIVNGVNEEDDDDIDTRLEKWTL